MNLGVMQPEDFLKEAVTMTNMRHENIVCMIGVSLEEPFWIVTELLGNGDLKSYLKKMLDDDNELPFPSKSVVVAVVVVVLMPLVLLLLLLSRSICGCSVLVHSEVKNI